VTSISIISLWFDIVDVSSRSSAMPRFFFDLRNERGSLKEDDVGVDLPDFETTYIEAHRTAIDIWAEACHDGRDPGHDAMLARAILASFIETRSLQRRHREQLKRYLYARDASE
jgi:hypothetical protein